MTNVPWHAPSKISREIGMKMKILRTDGFKNWKNQEISNFISSWPDFFQDKYEPHCILSENDMSLGIPA